MRPGRLWACTTRALQAGESPKLNQPHACSAPAHGTARRCRPDRTRPSEAAWNYGRIEVSSGGNSARHRGHSAARSAAKTRRRRFCHTATGIRTRVSAMRGRRPSPLDDSGEIAARRLAKPAARVRSRRLTARPRATGCAEPLRYLRLRTRGCGGIGRRARFRSVSGQPGGGSSPLIRIASKALQTGAFPSPAPPRRRLPGMFVLLPVATTYVCTYIRGPAVSAPSGSESS